MITADAITDEQLRELNESERGLYEALIALGSLSVTCSGKRVTEWRRQRARARCAEILNARAAGQLWDPIKRGSVRMVKCRGCGLEFFEGDMETKAHERTAALEILNARAKEAP